VAACAWLSGALPRPRSHELREPRFKPAHRYVTRTLEELSAVFDVFHVGHGSSAALEQRWRGAVQSSGTTGFVQRRFVVSPNSAVRAATVQPLVLLIRVERRPSTLSYKLACPACW
jgi:hypothetical protein